MRTQFVLAELALRHGWPAARPGETLRVLDLGCGLGAASFAALQHLAAAGTPVHLHATDRSAASLKQMQELFAAQHALWQQATLDTSVSDLCASNEAPGGAAGGWDLVLISFALNEALESAGDELLDAWLRGWMDRLSPSGMFILIEPAGNETSVRVEQLRDWVAANGIARIAAPCLHHDPCPLLARGTNWCHEVRRWGVPDTVQFLNRRLFRSLSDVKFSFIALAPGDPPPANAGAEIFRLVAPMHPVNGRVVTVGCAADGQVHDYELLTRGLTRPQERDLLLLERGDLIRAESPQLVGDQGVLRAQMFQAVSGA